MMDDKLLLAAVAEDAGRDHSELPEVVELMRSRAVSRTKARQRRAVVGVAAAVAVLGVGISIATSHAPVPLANHANASQDQTVVAAVDPTTGVKVVPKSAQCFARPSTNPSESVSVVLGLKAGHPAPTVADYVAVCVEVWKAGELLAGPPYVARSAGDATAPGKGVAPSLLPCVGAGDQLLVMPDTTAEVCRRFGLGFAVD